MCRHRATTASTPIRVEGVTAIDRFQATAATEYKTGNVTVDVIDGKLTIDAVGGTNTKLNWAEIASAGPVTPDTTAPGAADRPAPAPPATPRSP